MNTWHKTKKNTPSNQYVACISDKRQQQQQQQGVLWQSAALSNLIHHCRE